MFHDLQNRDKKSQEQVSSPSSDTLLLHDDSRGTDFKEHDQSAMDGGDALEQGRYGSLFVSLHGQTTSTANAEVDGEDDSRALLQRHGAHRNKVSIMDRIKKALPTSSQLLWLASLSKYEIHLILVGSVGLIVSSVINLIIPERIGALIDDVTKDPNRQKLTWLAVSLLGLIVVMGVATFIRAYMFTLAGERVVARLRRRLFNAIIVQEIAFFDATKTGELINRLSSDTVRSRKCAAIAVLSR